MLKHVFLFICTVLLTVDSAKANCTAPVFNFCSIIIGSSDELDHFKTMLGMGPNRISQDNCIKFVDLVTSTSNWEQEMLAKTTDPCHALLISGHHDFANTAGDNPKNIVRNRYVYSDASYDWEAGGSTSPGARLDLAKLIRANPVCGDEARYCNAQGKFQATGDKSCFPTRPPNSGEKLLGEVLTVFTFACNMLRETKATTLYKGANSSDLRMGNFTFYERTGAIFNKAIHLFGFQHKAPAGIATAPSVKTFLKTLKVSYGGQSDFFTKYLNELSVVRQYENAGDDHTSDETRFKNVIAGKSDALGVPITASQLAMCIARQKPNCSMIEAARVEVCSQFGLPADNALCPEAELARRKALRPDIVIPQMIVCSAGKTEREQRKKLYCDHLNSTIAHIKRTGSSGRTMESHVNHLKKIQSTLRPLGLKFLPEENFHYFMEPAIHPEITQRIEAVF